MFSLLEIPFAKYNTAKVCEWMQEKGFDNNLNECRSWIRNGLHLLQASPHDYEKVNKSSHHTHGFFPR